MCGIAGFLDLSGAATAPDDARATLQRMIATLAHRGPDGTGHLVDAPLGLAHARLSIIDLSTGGQPMHNEDRSVWVACNGEIFNYLELRAELQRRGHRFATGSDTEVIVHLYEEHGEDFVAHLNGQFAIVLWDRRQQRLLLVRDRVGVRPLHYARSGRRLWFASEIKALLAVAPALRRLDLRGVAEAFTLWSPIDPQTAFAGVSSLPPGHLLVVGQDGYERLRRYWDWDFPSAPIRETRSIDAVAEELRGRLLDAVRLQLRADVPVGAYLSGGLDSAGLVSLIRTFSSQSLRTFSVTFEDPEFDESVHQLRVANYLGTDHSALHCRTADVGEAFPRLVRHCEAPVLRTAAVPLMLLSAHVRRQGLKVVLSGEGADEVFAGYDLFKEAKVRRFWAAHERSPWRPRLLQRLYPHLRQSPMASAPFAQQFFAEGLDAPDSRTFAHQPRWRTSRRALTFLSSASIASLQGFDAVRHFESQLPADLPAWPALARDQYVEAHTLLPGYLLSSQGDRVAMANGVEGRVPYLDHRLIEFAAGLPPRYKMLGLTEKRVLRKALAGLLPEDLLDRVKQPYRAPDSRSFFTAGKALDYVGELLGEQRLRDAGYFDPAPVARLLEKCRSGRALGFADNQAFVGVLSVMLLDHWFVRGEAFADVPVSAPP